MDVGSRVAFSPDGQQLAFLRRSPDQQEMALVIANADGTGERKVATRKSPAEFTGGPAWSPDGRVIALGSEAVVVAVNVRDGKETTFSSKQWLEGVGRVAWLPGGRGLVLSAYDQEHHSQIWYLAYPSGENRRVTNDMNDYRSVSVTADGKALVTVFTKSIITRLWMISQGEWRHAWEIDPGTSEADGWLGFSWMPDGRILYTSRSGGESKLWITDRDGSNPKEFPVAAAAGLGVSACPDGRYILFSSEGHIARVDADGGNLKYLTTGGQHFDFLPRCSPDGQWVVYLSTRADEGTLWKLPIDGGTPVQLRDNPTVRFAISPDGKSIACTGSDAPHQPMKLIVLPIQGGPPSKTFDVPPGILIGLDWARDGRSLTFSTNLKDGSNIWAQPLAGGAPKQLTEFETDRIFSLAWSPDGKRLAFVRYPGSTTSDAVLISSFEGSEK